MASSPASAAAQRLDGKTVLITGATSGIGRATAFEFARVAAPHRIRLLLAARRLPLLQEVAAELAGAFGRRVEVLTVPLDVSQPEQVRAFVPSLPAAWQEIDVLVNNAGVAKGFAGAPNIAEADLNDMFATNVTGAINMTQAVLPIFLRRPDGGRGDIVSLGSIAGREPYVGGSIYCATKAALHSFSDSLRKELVATRIRVIEVDPGQVETNFSVIRNYGDKSKADAIYANCEPLTPDDVAEVIVFAVSRRENLVVADALLFPSHQASATIIHRKAA
ncbi:NADP-dependent L-serine/L-allo-threonine dehydrogenase ydfG [Niveomyces insectorum RCEF 264]|uniref:NADP-dependent L-serine/L-allo-threonine dehydrogenase ydfG n=1 Tax=Niveomyces insectorum RCEF 264 TaxID=1081102 RepID=A0A167U305_9HYPO|nr:NADP-dependent L-serine/L-allo-threonine dehydrogenase ydfG [Niveomyces insectorum RCEF 264]